MFPVCSDLWNNTSSDGRKTFLANFGNFPLQGDKEMERARWKKSLNKGNKTWQHNLQERSAEDVPHLGPFRSIYLPHYLPLVLIARLFHILAFTLSQFQKYKRFMLTFLCILCCAMGFASTDGDIDREWLYLAWYWELGNCPSVLGHSPTDLESHQLELFPERGSGSIQVIRGIWPTITIHSVEWRREFRSHNRIMATQNKAGAWNNWTILIQVTYDMQRSPPESESIDSHRRTIASSQWTVAARGQRTFLCQITNNSQHMTSAQYCHNTK